MFGIIPTFSPRHLNTDTNFISSLPNFGGYAYDCKVFLNISIRIIYEEYCIQFLHLITLILITKKID